MSVRGIRFWATLGLCLTSAALPGVTRAQSSLHERPKTKNFGSSLKRLKWDEQRKVSVETKLKKEAEKRSAEEEGVRVETSLVVSDVLVLDEKGRAVRGLTRDDFVVTEDGRPQQIGTFALGDNAALPRSIVLIIDHSMGQLGFIKSSVEAAKTLVDKLGPRDRMAIVTGEVKLLADFTQDKARLKERLDSLSRESASREWLFRRRGGAHYSALMATLRELFSGQDLRPIIIFQAHGNEASLLQESVAPPTVPAVLFGDEREEAQRWAFKMQQSLRPHMREFSFRDICEAAEKSRATIYAINPSFRLIGLSPDEQVKRIKDWEVKSASEWAEAAPGSVGPRQFSSKNHWEIVVDAAWVLKEQIAMAELAKLTGGWADFVEEPAQAAAVYSRILSDVNRRYVLGYYPTNKEHDGRRREVKIEVRGHPEYTIWGRKTYYAPGQ